MMKSFAKNNKNNSGFTLVETLVAISIFTVSLLGLMSILSQSIISTNYAKQKMIASYLAQEGIEYIRNMRDTFVLYNATSSQAGWDAFKAKLTAASCQTSNGCYFDDQNLNYTNHLQPMANIAVTACGASCPPLLYDQTTGKYGYATGTNSRLIRKINMNVISANEIKVLSTVYWIQGSGTYNMVLSENLFNWVE
jgi:prepilin-type N-terminal cleavage/methylation domain-containing protein